MVQDRYRELLRAFRQYQHITQLMDAGLRTVKDITPGGLVHFCYTCPRIGVNVDDTELEEHQYVPLYSMSCTPCVSFPDGFTMSQ